VAVAIEFVNVIVRKPVVERCYPGGLDGFARQDLANLTEDDHLLRVGFMSTRDALAFVSELEAVGLRYLGQEANSDIAIVVRSDDDAPPWLSIGSVNGHPACWANGQAVGEVAWPEPGFLLRCPRPVYDSLSELVGQCGAKVHEEASGAEAGALAQLRCSREEGEIIIDVVGERQGDSPIGLWGQRQLARRKHYQADVALIHDLVAVLKLAGAEGR